MPVSMLPIQRKYCTTKGPFKPNSSLVWSYSCWYVSGFMLVFTSPSIMVTGSPGINL